MKFGRLTFAPGSMVAAGVVVAAVVAGAAVALNRGGTTSAPQAPSTAGGDQAAVSAALSSNDWGAVTVPRAACEPSAAGDVTLAQGKGSFTVGALTYSVSANPGPVYGELQSRPAAVLQLTCALEGANAVAGLPIAVFSANADGVRLLGVVRNQDLGTAPETSSALVPSSETFVEGQIVIAGAYLQDNDPRCCASGTGWTTIRWQGDALVPSGVITAGEPPATLPTPSANLITYPGGVAVQTEADLAKLVGAPDEFKQFVLTQVPPTEAPCNQPGKVIVQAIRLDGYAVGNTVYHCAQAGHEVLWVLIGGAWKQLAASEDVFDCAPLKAATFPATLLGSDPHCMDGQGQYVVYDDGTTPPSSTAETLPPGVQLVDYRDSAGSGMSITSATGVDKLHDAPDDFKAFIQSEFKKLTAKMNSAAIAQCHPQVTVYALRTDGFAIGGETACGGAQDLWARVGGSWKTALGMQNYPKCGDLRSLNFPPEVFNKGFSDICVEDGGRQVKYTS